MVPGLIKLLPMILWNRERPQLRSHVTGPALRESHEAVLWENPALAPAWNPV